MFRFSDTIYLMSISTIITTIFALIVIFLFAVQKFGHQIQRVAGEKLKTLLHNSTDNPVKGALGGAFITALLQSSTATSVILVGLVNAGVLQSTNALGVVIGANIGTTITAQLVALNMTYIAPIIVIIGFIVGHTHSRFRKYGKSIFYFGLIFLTLFIISNIASPLKDNIDLQNFLRGLTDPYKAILVGSVITAIMQSSSVFTALTLILVANGLISLPIALGFMIGSAIGSPLTAIIASTSASFEAKKVAISHVIFNILGVIIFTPLLYPFTRLLEVISDNEIQQVVNAHFIFNISCAVICLVFFKYFEKSSRIFTKALYKN
jgi:phosphate:Na+ symporter